MKTHVKIFLLTQTAGSLLNHDLIKHYKCTKIANIL